MAYCTWEDVQEKLQLITFSGSSKPSSSDVTGFSEEITEDMDSRMQASGVNLPVTDAGKLKILKAIAVNGVKAEVLRSVSQDLEDAMRLQKLYDDALKRIANNPDIINSEVVVSQGPGTFIPSSADPVVERFQRGVKQW